MFAAFFRAFWQATAVGGPDCKIGVPELGAGVFGNPREDVISACMLAHTAYVATGGTAHVHMVLRSSDGTEPTQMGAWRDAVDRGIDAELLTEGFAANLKLLERVPTFPLTYWGRIRVFWI